MRQCPICGKFMFPVMGVAVCPQHGPLTNMSRTPSVSPSPTHRESPRPPSLTLPEGAQSFPPLPPSPLSSSSSPIQQSPLSASLPSSSVVNFEVILPDKDVLINIYILVMKEKNEGVFHPSEPLHQLWWAFEYFHERFAKKVAIEVVSTLAPIGISTGLGAGAAGGAGALMALGGATTTQMISSSTKAISKKLTRQSEMDTGLKEFFAASSVDQTKEINPYAKLAEITSPGFGAVSGMARASLGFGEMLAAKKISAQGVRSNRSPQVDARSRQVLQNQPPLSKQSVLYVQPGSREANLNEIYIWHGYYIMYRADSAPDVAIKAIRDALDFDIYYKPPKSGSLNKYVLNYSFFLDYIKQVDKFRSLPMTEHDETFKTIKNNTFKALDYFWQMSRTWPMLDYLFFNYGFYKFFNDFLTYTVQDRGYKVNEFLYACRLYFLSKNFYLEHFFRIILPTYELVLHAHRRDAMANIPGNILDKLTHVLKEKYNTSQSSQTSGLFRKIKSAIESSHSPRNFVKNAGIKKNLAPFLILIKEYSDKIKNMDSIDQLSLLNRLLITFFDQNTEMRSLFETGTPLSPPSSGIYLKLEQCANPNFQTIINSSLRSFFQTERIEFIKDPQLKHELRKVKNFFYSKMHELIVNGNVSEAWLDIGRIDLVVNLFDQWIAEYEKDTDSSPIADFSMGVLNGAATMVAVYSLSYLIESKALARIKRKVPRYLRQGIRFLFHTISGVRISLGTVNYMHEVFLRTHANIFDLVGHSVLSSGWISAALVGPNIFSLSTAILIQSLRASLYDDMDRECLNVVDRLVQETILTETPPPTPHAFPSYPSSSGVDPVSKRLFATQSSDTSSIPIEEDQDQLDMLFCRVFIYQSIAENLKQAFDNNALTQTFVAGEVLQSPIADELGTFDRHLNQALSLLKKCNSETSKKKLYQDNAESYLFFSESILHYINIKNIFFTITAKPAAQLNDNDLRQIKTIIDYFNAFYMALDGAINIVLRIQEGGVSGTDERLEIINATNKVIYSLHSKTKDYFLRIVYNLATWVKQLVQNYKPNFVLIHQYQTFSDEPPQEYKLIVTSYQSTVNECNLIIVALSQQIFKNNQRTSAPPSAEQQTNIQALRAKEKEYAGKLKLDLALTKPFSTLTEVEKLILYRDFGRVLRHLFENVPTPSELMERAQELEDLIGKITKSTNVDDINIKDFVNKQFEYTRAVLLKENFVYYSRVYQFLSERLRIEFLSNSHTYFHKMKHKISSEPLNLEQNSFMQQNERASPQVKMQALFEQLDEEYKSFLGAQSGEMNLVRPDGVSTMSRPFVCTHPNAGLIPPGMSSASSHTQYCPRCGKTF